MQTPFTLKHSILAAGGYNGFGGSADIFSKPTGFVGGILAHTDCRFTLSSDTLNFSVSGNTISASAIPVPAAIWPFWPVLAFLVARNPA